MDTLRFRKMRIIDDETDFSLLLKANLEESIDCEATTADSGEEGLKGPRTHQPDLIFLDVMMPGMDGLEVLKRLKEDPKTLSIPVVMLTSVADQQVKQRAGSLYDEEYIEKPIETAVLKEKIEQVCSQLGR